MRAAPYVDCPSCGAMRVTRLHRRCRRCRVLLVYVGELVFREDDEPAWCWSAGRWQEWEPGANPPFTMPSVPHPSPATVRRLRNRP